MKHVLIVEKGKWGCNLFTADQGWKVIDDKTQALPYIMTGLAGGLASDPDQVPLCA